MLRLFQLGSCQFVGNDWSECLVGDVLVTYNVAGARLSISDSTVRKGLSVELTGAEHKFYNFGVFVKGLWRSRMLMSSTCLAVRRSCRISNSGSRAVDMSPIPTVVLCSFKEKPLDASLIPVPGLVHWKQCMLSSKCSKPGRVLSSSALPGGTVKQHSRSCSLVASASSLYVNPFKKVSVDVQ